MRSTEKPLATSAGTDSNDVRTGSTQSVCAKTELLFAADDTSNVNTFHAKTTWGRRMTPALSMRINAFLGNTLLRQIVSRSRNEYSDTELIALPEVALGTITLQEALLRRRSLTGNPRPHHGAIGIEDVAAILKYSYGIVGERRGGGAPVQRLRTCPSAGALYPLEIYPVVMDVEGLASGLYHYDAINHGLSCLRHEDTRRAMPGFDFQPYLKEQASVVFIVTAVLLRSMAKYLDRGYRFVMNEAGALTQNMQLTALARGVSGCVWGGFCDDDVAAYVGADGSKEIVVLGFILGKSELQGGAAS